MKIEEGKYYRTRDGRKVGPMSVAEDARFLPWRDAAGQSYDGVGQVLPALYPDSSYHGDIIEEWRDNTMTDEYWTPEAEDHDVTDDEGTDRLLWLETELETAFGKAIERGEFSTAMHLHLALEWVDCFAETGDDNDLRAAADILEQAGM